MLNSNPSPNDERGLGGMVDKALMHMLEKAYDDFDDIPMGFPSLVKMALALPPRRSTNV